jgi:peroxiredoxin
MFLRSLASERARVKQAMEEQVADAGLVRLGEMAPSFRVVDVDGNEFSLDQMRGKVVLVNFFATWCGQCITELPHVEEIWKANSHSDEFTALVIGREETNETAIAFRKEQRFSFRVAADPDCSVYFRYAKKYIPRTYLISREGKVCFSSAGWSEADAAALKKELASQLHTAH